METVKKTSGLKRNFKRTLTFLSKPHHVILLFFLVMLTLLVVIPLVYIVVDSFTVHSMEVMRIPGAKAGELTLYHWTKVFFDKTSFGTFWTPLINSLVTSLGACVIAILFGGVFAWLITRSNMRWKKAISKLLMFPYIMPSWALALAWMNIFKNQTIGGEHGIFEAITGLATPNWFAYGALPIIIVTGIHFTPFAYILIGGTLRNMDANLEESAVILKTKRLRMFWRVTIPMVVPAILSAFILSFSGAMSSFAVPKFLGLPVRYYVLTTRIYTSLSGTNPGYGYALALVLVALSAIIMSVNQRIIGKRRSYATVTGKSANISFFDLKKGRAAVSILMFLIVFCISILPLITFALQSVIMVKGNYSPDNFTLVFWTAKAQGGSSLYNQDGILVSRDVWFTLLNSLKVSAVAAIGAGTLGFLAGYGIVKKRGTLLSKTVEQLTFLPYLIPGMSFSVIYLAIFSVRHGFVPALYGTITLLMLIAVVKYLPMASRAGVNSMLQLSSEIEEAALIEGIPWFKRMTRIVIPIQKTTVLSGYLLPFISCMRELSLFVLLCTPANRVLTALLFMYDDKGWDQYANAINLLIVVIVLIINALVEKLTDASIEKGVGG